jgi:hypothetical protein
MFAAVDGDREAIQHARVAPDHARVPQLEDGR